MLLSYKISCCSNLGPMLSWVVQDWPCPSTISVEPPSIKRCQNMSIFIALTHILGLSCSEN